tara:strand:+ start:828 stop:1919 length:1092 start_codon:yes stop_codon:yes gene_type:complete
MMTQHLKTFLIAAVFLMILAYLLPLKTVSAQTAANPETAISRIEVIENNLMKLNPPSNKSLSRLELKLQPLMGGGLSPNGMPVPLRQYGYEQLRAEDMEFDPVANPAPPAGYRMGPGDEVVIYSVSEPNLVRLRISADGKLRHPAINPIQVANRTFEEVQAQLSKENRFMDLVLEKLRSIQVNIIGEATNPGLHRVPATANVAQVISLSGGIRSSGSLRKIEWRRNRKLLTRIDLYDYLLKGLSPRVSHLESGDTLFIPLIKKAVAIDGAVWRPGIYELKKETSLKQVVELAGGFQPDYLTDCIVLERLNPSGRELIAVMNGKNYLGTAVRNFDVIKIYPNSSILPKYFCLDTPQNKALSLNQ